ncbi:MAG: glycosyltransferase [Acidimicrobiales bacterium]
MRALFSCMPGFGHFHPMVALAEAWKGAGHELAFATAERFCHRVIEPAGFPAFAAGPSPRVYDELTGKLPEVAAMAAPDPWRYGAYMFAHIAAPLKVDDLLGIIDRWEPDVIVHGSVDFAGPAAASARGLRWVSHSSGALQPVEFWDLSGALVAPLWRGLGLEPDPAGGVFRHLYLDICPSSFQAAEAGRITARRPMRPIPFDTIGAASVPEWFDSLPEQPTVYVTMGTVNNDAPGVFEAVLAGLGDTDLNVITTVGLDRDPQDLGSLPPNVHVERWIPQSLVFGACDAVVCHGGSGTTLTALAHGVPLLLLPQGANQFWNAERCVTLGAGLMLSREETAGDRVRLDVDRLLTEPSFSWAARSVGREIEDMPAPDVVVPFIEALGAAR